MTDPAKTIRIGTRQSPLALYQARKIKTLLENIGLKTSIKPIKSDGDKNLEQPLYQIGIVGLFTKALDSAMLNNKIDVAVHSMKDVPTKLPEGISQGAVIKRDSVKDCLVFNSPYEPDFPCVIATGSLRRKAQWLNKYPHHQIDNIRGNIQTRFEKLDSSKQWNGVIFALAGLNRLQINRPLTTLDWMIPAPAQGAIMVSYKTDNIYLKSVLNTINDKPTEMCTSIERDFLNTLEGGCTAPIGALAKIENNKILFNGILLSEDGLQKIHIERTASISEYNNIGKIWAREVLAKGGDAIVKTFRK